MNRRLTLLTLVLAVIATGGCKREAEAPPATEAATPVVAEAVATDVKATTGTDVISEVDHNSPASAAPGFDAKAFAGSYAGAGITLEVHADGRYRLTARSQSAGADVVSAGTWTAEADGTHVLLDPESKNEADRRFQVIANRELREAGATLVLTRSG